MGERLLPGSSEETVYILLLDAVFFCVELALNSMKFAGALSFGDKVDSGIFCVETLLSGPISIGPNLVVEICVGRFVAEVGED